MKRRDVIGAAAAGLGLTAVGWARAQQDYPQRPLRVVLPYPAGGNTDVTTREVMRELAAVLRQPIVVDNKAGANSIIGTDAVAKAAPDGYTLLTVVGAFTINPALYRTLPYTVEQFAPISLVGRVNLILAVGEATSVHSVAELVKLGQSGKELTFDSSGIGSALHLVGERIAQETGIKALHVPYKGIAQSLPDIVSGRIVYTLNTASSLGPFIRDGKLKALAVMSKARSAEFPNVPTIAEAGYPQLESYAWQGLLAPAKTPASIVQLLSGQVAAVVQTPAMRARLATMGTDAIGSTPEEFAAFIRDDLAKAAAVVKLAGIKAE